MKKILSLLLALVMIVSLTAVVAQANAADLQAEGRALFNQAANAIVTQQVTVVLDGEDVGVAAGLERITLTADGLDNLAVQARLNYRDLLVGLVGDGWWWTPVGFLARVFLSRNPRIIVDLDNGNAFLVARFLRLRVSTDTIFGLLGIEGGLEGLLGDDFNLDDMLGDLLDGFGGLIEMVGMLDSLIVTAEDGDNLVVTLHLPDADFEEALENLDWEDFIDDFDFSDLDGLSFEEILALLEEEGIIEAVLEAVNAAIVPGDALFVLTFNNGALVGFGDEELPVRIIPGANRSLLRTPWLRFPIDWILNLFL